MSPGGTASPSGHTGGTPSPRCQPAGTPSPSGHLGFIVPAWRAAETIGETIESIRRQSVGPCPIIVVDDGSPDDSAAIARRLAWPHVQVVSQRNAGLAAARNAGLAELRCEWACFLDADDRIAPDFAERLLAHARGDVIACGYRYLSAGGEETGWSTQPEARDFTIERLLEGNAFAIGALAFRTAALRDLARRDGHAFDPSLPVLEDWDLLLRLAARGATLAPIVEAPLFEYRLGEASLSTRLALMHETGVKVLSRAARDGTERERALRRWTLRSLGRALAAADAPLATRLANELAAQALSPQSEGPALIAGALRTELRRQAAAAGKAGEATHPAEPQADAWKQLAGTILPADSLAALERLAHPGRSLATVAAELAAPRGRRIVLAGMGRNGRALAAELEQRGTSPQHGYWIDDAPQARGPQRWRRLDWPDLRPGDLVVATPDDSAPLLRRAQAAGVDAIALADLRSAPAASPPSPSAASTSP